MHYTEDVPILDNQVDDVVEAVAFERSTNLSTLIRKELECIPSEEELDFRQQNEFSDASWKNLVQYIFKICLDYKASPGSLALALNLSARFFCYARVARQRYRLVAAACAIIAFKFLEMRHPCMKEISVRDGTFSLDELKKMERYTLYALNWKIFDTSPFTALSLILEEAQLTFDITLHRKACDLVDKVLLQKHLLSVRPTSVAFATLFSALRVLQKEHEHAGKAVQRVAQTYSELISVDEIEEVINFLQEEDRPETPAGAAWA